MRSYNTSFWMNRIVWLLPTLFTVIVKYFLDKYSDSWNIHKNILKKNKNLINNCLKFMLILIFSSIFGIFMMLITCYYVNSWIFINNDLVIISFYIVKINNMYNWVYINGIIINIVNNIHQ
jgi:hypothetical protein